MLGTGECLKEGELRPSHKLWIIFKLTYVFSPLSLTHLMPLFMPHFIYSRKFVSLKFTEELSVITVKNDAKFEEALTCQFKIDMRNWTNFDPSIRKSQEFAL